MDSAHDGATPTPREWVRVSNDKTDPRGVANTFGDLMSRLHQAEIAASEANSAFAAQTLQAAADQRRLEASHREQVGQAEQTIVALMQLQASMKARDTQNAANVEIAALERQLQQAKLQIAALERQLEQANALYRHSQEEAPRPGDKRKATDIPDMEVKEMIKVIEDWRKTHGQCHGAIRRLKARFHSDPIKSNYEQDAVNQAEKIMELMRQRLDTAIGIMKRKYPAENLR